MADWQPIETAPKDGSRLLAGYLHKGQWVYRIAHTGALDRWLSDPGDWAIQPTHWMHLPDPPSATSTPSSHHSNAHPH